MNQLRLLLFSALLTIPLFVSAQTLHGSVYIAGTETGIAGASVYYNASTIGTSTKATGDFTLPEHADHLPLTISCVGYTTVTVNNYDAKTNLKIYLKPKTQVLHEVVIGSDGMSRKDKEKIFLKQFLGTSSFAQSCTITNLSAVELTYHRKTQTLTAACDTPLQIDNKALGYHINYFLQEFTYSPTNTNFSGNYFYKGVFPLTEQRKVSENRELAYRGSRLQFIRALWADKLKEKGFNIYSVELDSIGHKINYKPLAASSIIRIDSGRKFINMQNKNLVITYGQDKTALMQSEPTLISNTGYYGTGLHWYGGIMSAQRIGDNLPFEYWPDGDIDEKPLNSGNSIVSVKPESDSVITQPFIKEKEKPSLLFEKVYLHTDRDTYVQGDTLWFKAYLLNGQSNRLENSSNNLYVELIAPDSAKIIVSRLVRLENGSGNGDMALADSLPAGKYLLRAYTNWMRNFGDNFIYEKDITVLNIADVPVSAATPQRKTTNAAPATISKTKTTAAPDSSIVRFYPEGGSLVQGVSAVVGVKAEDANGKGIAAKGSIISSAGDTLAHFSCDTLGLGLFAMLPVAGQSYHTKVNFAGEMPSRSLSEQVQHNLFQLPNALSKGLTLQIRQTDSLIQAQINTGGLNTHTVSLLVKHTGKTVLSRQLNIQGTQLAFKINKVNLPEGISVITLYDEQGKPECERLVYIHHADVGSQVKITSDKKSYSPNEQVSMNVHTEPHAHLSMAVIDAGAVSVQSGNILSYINLQSEIRGTIESPNRYFDTTNINRAKQLDMLLLTQGWRDFVWRRLADTAIRISYAAENSIAVSGKIRDENRNKFLPKLNISLFANESKSDRLFNTVSDSLGRFTVNGLLFYGKGTIKLSAVDSKGQSKGTFWVDTLLPMPIQKHLTKPAEMEAIPNSGTAVALKKKAGTVGSPFNKVTALKEVSIVDNRYKKYTLPNGTTYSAWGTSLNQSLDITLKDYEFRNFRWYAIAHLNGARADINGTGILIPESGHLVHPMIIVTKGGSENRYSRVDFYSMPIDRFKHIEFKRVYVFARDGNPGFITYLILLELRDNYNTDNPGELAATVQGYDEPRTFYKPLNEKDAAKYAYRSTIHWEPNITTDASGNATVNFYNTNLNANTKIIIEGITGTGDPLTAIADYQTKVIP